MQRIVVTRTTADIMTAEVWTFWFDDGRATLWLDSYVTMARPTLRHKLGDVFNYRRIDGRSNTIALPDVPLPDDVASEAKAAIVERITVRKWDRD
jgi:hypothetical protein